MENETKDEYVDRIRDSSHPVVYESSPRVNNVPPNTDITMEGCIRKMWNFLSIIGNDEAFESMLLLLAIIPPNNRRPYPSIPIKFLMAFVQHQFGDFGDHLTVEGTEYYDWSGNPILCASEVNTPRGFGNFWSAMTYLHQHRLQSGSYQEKCQVCYHNRFFHASDSCIRGGGDCPVVHSGLSTHDPRKVSFMKKLKTSQKGKRYRGRPRDYLFPTDLYKFHENLVSADFALNDLKHYTLTLLSVTQAGLRFQGTQYKGFGSFQHARRHWHIEDNKMVYGLAHFVHEKTDQGYYLYLLRYGDPECPKLCTLRHLLVFIHCSNHRNGSVFPETVVPYDPETHEEELVTNDLEDAFKDEDGNNFLMKTLHGYLINNVSGCENSSNVKVSSHIFRRSFYLFAWYCILFHVTKHTIIDIKRNARHATEEMAQLYSADSHAIAERMVSNPEKFLRYPVPRFPDSLVANDGNTNLRLNQMLGHQNHNIFTLSHAAELFVTNMLNVPPTHEKYRNAKFLLLRSYGMQLGKNKDATAIERCYKYIDSELPEQHSSKLRELFTDALVHQNSMVSSNLVAASNMVIANPPPQGAVNVITPVSPPTSPGSPPPTQVVLQNPTQVPPPPLYDNFHPGTDFDLLNFIPVIRSPPVYPAVQLNVFEFQCIGTDPSSSESSAYKIKNLLMPKIRKSPCSITAALAIYRLTLEIACLSGQSTVNNNVYHRFIQGRPRCRKSRSHLFNKEPVHLFACCLTACHNDSIESFISANPEFKPNEFACESCHETH
eukprot:CAMPEP_0178933602 /NCGR_PEP_ID=MMETSP0786-20121207/23365_1 /TAXON_ID=186022 /ORGANISM="Thalassionema frauenfeldii, Strain CCMP 1798" /LENGTH=772 /DNA_ID=CAMNT_0020611225 /DNA_START=1739 /DNA_END=4057 /DNA_ORIENTATION=-